MAKRGLNEPAIRQQIASKTGGGSFADKAGKLADTQTYGQKGKGAPDSAAREKLAITQRGNFRKTTSSRPGLSGYAHQSSDPAVKAKQDARGNQRARAALTPNERKQLNMEFDLYDTILAHLINEGYADTNENALVIMANMSGEWRENIIEQQTDPLKTAAENSKKRNDAYGSKKFQQVVDDSPSNPRSKNFNPNSLKTPGV